MIGQTYYERGRPVKVLIVWQGPSKTDEMAAKVERLKRRRGTFQVVFVNGIKKRGGPRNVLIQREDGTLVVRPFRGLRKAP